MLKAETLKCNAGVKRSARHAALADAERSGRRRSADPTMETTAAPCGLGRFRSGLAQVVDYQRKRFLRIFCHGPSMSMAAFYNDGREMETGQWRQKSEVEGRGPRSEVGRAGGRAVLAPMAGKERKSGNRGPKARNRPNCDFNTKKHDRTQHE